MNRRVLLPLLCAWPAILLAQTQGPSALPTLPMPGAPGAPAPGGPGGPAAGAQALGELREIAPPVDVPFWNTRNTTLAVLGGVLLLLLLAWAVRRWLKRARPLPPPPDPVQTALKALEKLAATGSELSPKEFASAVAGVIRRFLESKHGLAAPRQTTEEFLENIERSNRFELPIREQMRLFLSFCDELKFSRVDASADARKGLLDSAFKMVREDLA